jgi:hypothetical protein
MSASTTPTVAVDRADKRSVSWKTESKDLVQVTLFRGSRGTTDLPPSHNRRCSNDSADDNSSSSSSAEDKPIPLPHWTPLVIPVAQLEQREVEMNQIARLLGIPKERWNGSLLYLEWQNQVAHCKKFDLDEAMAPRTFSIGLFPEQTASTAGGGSCLAFHSWTRTLPTLTWIQSMLARYYATGTLVIPTAARGYDVLASMDFFGILYAPDQCHFGDYSVYQRVQQWSRYLCHRSELAMNVVQVVLEQQQQVVVAKVTFGTVREDEHAVEMDSESIFILGGDNSPVGHKVNLAKIAYKLFNAATGTSAQTATGSHHRDANAEEEEITLPGPEESTAIEMRQDFTAYVTRILSVAMNQRDFTISFPVKAVTIRSNVGDGSDQDGIGNSLTTVIEHRAVLIVDLSSFTVQPPCTELSPEAHVWTQLRPKILCQSRSDLSAPIDELVDEELTKVRSSNGHVRQIETRSVSFKDTSMDETLATTAPSTPQSTCEVNVGSTPASPQEQVATEPFYVTLADQIKATSVDSAAESAPSTSWHRPTSFGTNTSTTISAQSQHSPPMLDDDYNAPHDELNASMDTGVLSHRSAPLVGECPVAKKKRKPKPVFELPEKLFSEDSLSRGLAALTKPQEIGGVNLLNDLSLPAPITIVRTPTYDNTVTSALTGPFYIDDQGNLRDVFEHSPEVDKDGDDDDDDTRAQARRHEWIQTALLNRGIGERMETLLKQEAAEEPTTPALTNMDPWEWLTGLGVCEFSRSLMKSVEEYANGIGGDLRRDPDQSMPATDLLATTENVAMAESGATVEPTANTLTSSSAFAKSPVVHFADSNEAARNSSPIVSDSAPRVQAQLHLDGQSQEDVSQLADCNIELIDQNDSREGNASQSSTESPRGVHTFDELPIDVTKQRQEQSHSIHIASYTPTDGTREARRPTTATKAEVVPKRKNRGITALFRRRKENL